MKTPAAITRIFDALDRHHPDADTELAYRNPFELLVATMLSAQSTDARVNLVTPALFARYPDARAMAAADTVELEALDSRHGLLPAEGPLADRHVDHAGRAAPRQGARVDGRTGRAARSRAQDGERRPRPCAGGAWASRGPPRAEGGQSPRPRAFRRSGEGGSRAERDAAAGTLDARVGHADPPRPACLQADPALPALSCAARLRLCPDRHDDEGGHAASGARRRPAAARAPKKSVRR